MDSSPLMLFAQTLAAIDPAETASNRIFILRLVILAVLVAGSFGLGWLAAKLLRLRDVGFKIGLVLFTAAAGISPFIDTVLVRHKPLISAFKFGIDLAGGTNLVYQLERTPADPATMDRMVGAIRRRIDPSGTQELAIRQVGKDQIEIIIPGEDPETIKGIKDRINRIGSLEFDVLANQRDHRDLIRRALLISRDLKNADGKTIAGWRPIAPRIPLDAKKKPLTDSNGKIIEEPNREFGEGGDISVRRVKGKPEGFQEVLVVIDPDPERRVTGKYLLRAAPTLDEGGRPAVNFNFNQRGAFLFSQLTSSNKPLKDGFKRRLAILLDDKVQSAPVINQTIGAQGIIQGSFTSEEVDSLVSVLNAGALEVGLKSDPISEFTISPLLGADVQKKGKLALIVATVSVFVFMVAYYLVLGLIADLCLLLNVVLLLGIMSFIDATLTLPGLAGMVLTIGMAVDANVLIYERIREELRRGSNQRMAIHNGFVRAFSSIFDSNITTLLSAVILYMIGSDQVKGFAVTLFLGIGLSMFTALYVNRLCLEIIERKRWLKELKMLSAFGETHIDFVGKQVLAVGGSVALIAVGLIAFAIRGQANYDIDFTGGTMVTIHFDKPQDVEEVRQRLTKSFSSDITVEKLTRSNEPADEKDKRFRMRTIDQDEPAVTEKVNETFHDELTRVTMQFAELRSIPSAADAKQAAEEKEKTEKKTDAAVKFADEVSEENKFSGGHEVALSFSLPVAPVSMERYVANELVKVQNDKGGPKYGSIDDVTNLFYLGGTEQETAGEATGTVKTYKTLELKVVPAVDEKDLKTILVGTQETLANSPLFDEVNNFESSVAAQALQSAILAIIASVLVIVAYVWYRFENLVFGLSAVLALAHDVLAVLGLLSLASLLAQTPIGPFLLLSDFKINLTMVAAFLTIVGYSLNDTIIIFDRLREIRGKNPVITRDMLNLSVNQTLSRTMLTAGTTFIVVLILYVLGGEGIHGFAFAMLMGVIVGTYSSVYVASPVVLWIVQQKPVKAGRPLPPAANVAKATR